MFVQLILNYVFDRQFVLQAFATLTTFAIIRITLFIQVRRRRFKLFDHYGIKGPELRLLDGNMGQYRQVQSLFLLDSEFREKYGKVYRFFIGDEPSLIITDLDILKAIFFERNASFKERANIFMKTPLNDSILFARHNRWKFIRKVISPAFTAFSMRGEASTQFVEDGVKEMLDYIDNKLDSQEMGDVSEPALKATGIEFDAHDLMKATALKLINGLAINLPGVTIRENDPYVESLDSFLRQADSGVVLMIIKFPMLKPIVEFLAAHLEHGKTMASIRKSLNRTIDEGIKKLKRQASSKATTTTWSNEPPGQAQLIDTMIRLHYEGKLSRTEVIGNCEAILFAGYDTTSTTMVYIFWLLGKHPEIQEKLRHELMAHGTESTYLEQVINETMRLYPTVVSFTTRMSTENVTIGKLTIPSGVRVLYNSWLIHRDPELWPEPEKFDPDRFRPGVEHHPCAFAPFGLSDRKCLGYSLAKLELKMITCSILMRYRLTTRAPEKLELVSFGVALSKPKDKIIMRLEKLSNGI